MFLNVSGPILVLWIHILAATIWIGGQITLAALVPILRGQAGLATVAARRFQWVAWPAFALLLLTGILNARNAGIDWQDLHSTAQGRTLTLKLGFVVLSGLGAAVHANFIGPRASASRSSRQQALSGAAAGIGLLAAVLAAFYGVVIAEH